MDELSIDDLNDAIAALSTAGRKPATIRKSIQTLATQRRALASDERDCEEVSVVRDHEALLRLAHLMRRYSLTPFAAK